MRLPHFVADFAPRCRRSHMNVSLFPRILCHFDSVRAGHGLRTGDTAGRGEGEARSRRRAFRVLIPLGLGCARNYPPCVPRPVLSRPPTGGGFPAARACGIEDANLEDAPMTGTVKAEPGLGHEVVGREVGARAASRVPGRGSRPCAASSWSAAPASARRRCGRTASRRRAQRGVRVLVARPSDAEARLAFSSLIDLFDGVASEELAGLPPPQLHALDVALLRAASAGDAPETHAVGVGCLNALRALAAGDPS